MSKEENVEVNMKAGDIGKVIDTYEKIAEKHASGFDAVITDVYLSTNTNYYGKSVFNERKGIVVVYHVDGFDDKEYSEFFSLPSIQGYPKSNLKLFKDKYGSLPKKDMKIKAYVNDEGFMKILMD